MKRMNVSFLILLALLFIPSLSFAKDSTHLNSASVLGTNIEKGSAGGVPVGTVIAWPVSGNPEDPENWLECNGQGISQSVYPELFAVVGSSVPNYQGIFLRGYGSQIHNKNNGSIIGVTATTHTSGTLGTIQGDAIRNITGGGYYDGANDGRFFGAAYQSSDRGYWGSGEEDRDNQRGLFDAGRVVPTANENRPVNTAVRYLIRSRN